MALTCQTFSYILLLLYYLLSCLFCRECTVFISQLKFDFNADTVVKRDFFFFCGSSTLFLSVILSSVICNSLFLKFFKLFFGLLVQRVYCLNSNGKNNRVKRKKTPQNDQPEPRPPTPQKTKKTKKNMSLISSGQRKRTLRSSISTSCIDSNISVSVFSFLR